MKDQELVCACASEVLDLEYGRRAIGLARLQVHSVAPPAPASLISIFDTASAFHRGAPSTSLLPCDCLCQMFYTHYQPKQLDVNSIYNYR